MPILLPFGGDSQNLNDRSARLYPDTVTNKSLDVLVDYESISTIEVPF